MSLKKNYIPLSLYIHIPWCIKKCPYCDFNSHTLKSELPENQYIDALIADLQQDLAQFSLAGRKIQSVFIGGGTPSLLAPKSIAALLTRVQDHICFTKEVEITLEANPGTVEQQRFQGFKAAGINRLSLGIQSFQAEKLRALGRIHDDNQAKAAIAAAQQAGFSNINLDLMFGLPQQSIPDALFDLQTALLLQPTHISWYQLTLEPNTAFYHQPPRLPADDLLWDMQLQGQALLAEADFYPYEISAYTRKAPQDLPCQHNLNYWLFGDYLGIGAGAHGKLTDSTTGTITRTWKTRHPKDYLDPATPFIAGQKTLSTKEIPLELMMNALRLHQSIPLALLAERSALSVTAIYDCLRIAEERQLLSINNDMVTTTELGKRYLNDLLQIFL